MAWYVSPAQKRKGIDELRIEIAVLVHRKAPKSQINAKLKALRTLQSR